MITVIIIMLVPLVTKINKFMHIKIFDTVENATKLVLVCFVVKLN